MMTDGKLRDLIPSEFYRGEEEKPLVKNVGELIEQLQRLPPKLPVEQGFHGGCRLVVYSISKKDAHLELEEDDD